VLVAHQVAMYQIYQTMHIFLPSYYQHYMNAAVNFMLQLLYLQEKRFVISGLEAV